MLYTRASLHNEDPVHACLDAGQAHLNELLFVIDRKETEIIDPEKATRPTVAKEAWGSPRPKEVHKRSFALGKTMFHVAREKTVQR